MDASDARLSFAAARFSSAAHALANRDCSDAEVLPSQLVDLIALLAEQSEWRFYVDATRNYGHQAATVSMLHRLIDLSAYSGRILVVYAEHGKASSTSTAEKLALMFAGLLPTDIDDAVVAYGTCKDVRFLAFDRRAELTEAVAFGFTGGADDMSINLALQLNVRFFARIQPYLWDDPLSASASAYFESSRIEQPSGAHLYMLEGFPAYRYLALKTAYPSTICPSTWEWYCNQDFDRALACRTNNLRAMLPAHAEGAKSAAPLLWPVYGLQHFPQQAKDILLVLILAALRLCTAHPCSIYLCLFSPSDELDNYIAPAEALADDLARRRRRLSFLSAALRNGRAYKERGKREARAAGVGALMLDTCPAIDLHIHRSYDPDTQRWSDIGERLAESTAYRTAPAVHVIEFGPVPAAMFHHCLTCAHLPPVIEGQASTNLLTQLGKPFLHLLRPEHEDRHSYPRADGQFAFPHVADEAGSIAALIRNLAIRDCACTDGEAYSAYCADVELIAEFLRNAIDPGSEAAAYFSSLGRHFRRNGHDKLLLSLLAMREVLMNGESP